MVEFEEEHDVTNSIAEASRNPHDLYVGKTEAEQVRAAIAKVPLKFREIICCENMKTCPIRKLQAWWAVLSEP
jgi:hypothetical protein